MKLQNEFTVNVPIERAWEVLTDIPAIAPKIASAAPSAITSSPRV